MGGLHKYYKIRIVKMSLSVLGGDVFTNNSVLVNILCDLDPRSLHLVAFATVWEETHYYNKKIHYLTFYLWPRSHGM